MCRRFVGRSQRPLPQELERGYHQCRPVSLTRSRARKASQIWRWRKSALWLPIFDLFGPAANAFLDSPAANGIAGFMFSEMHVKEQGLVKLRSKLALQGFHSSVSAASQSELSQVGSCGGTATRFRSYLAISHPFGSIQPGAAGFDWSSITFLLKGTPVMFVSVYLTCNTGVTGANLQKLSEIGAHVKDAGIPLRHCRRLERAAVWIVGIRLARPHQRGSFASFGPGNTLPPET